MFDLLKRLGEDNCCICKESLGEDFTLEHVEPWLYSEDPLQKYMDVGNIGFAHHKCNSGKARRDTPAQIKKFKSQRKYSKTHKFCPRCDGFKKLLEFSKHSGSASGRESHCRVCRKKKNTEARRSS